MGSKEQQEKVHDSAYFERLRTLLTQRKGVITRHVSKLRRLVTQRSKEEIPPQLKKSESAFEEFEGLFDEFCMSCNYVDDNTFNESWFDNVQTSYLEEYGRANAFLDSLTKPCPNPSPQYPKSFLDDFNATLNLPKVEIVPFDGDPIHYHAFIKSFMLNVDRVCRDPDAKIARLISCTRGSALEAIKGVQVKGGEEGYQRALLRLKELFGSKHCITQSIVTQLVSNKPAKSAEQVRALSSQLTNALDVLNDLDALDEVNSQIIIRAISQRFPSFAIREWEKKQLFAKKSAGSYLKFPDLVEFANDLESDMNDPLYGDAAKQQHKALLSAALGEPETEFAHFTDARRESSRSVDSTRVKKTRPKKGSGTKAGQRPPCSLCGRAHFIMVGHVGQNYNSIRATFCIRVSFWP